MVLFGALAYLAASEKSMAEHPVDGGAGGESRRAPRERKALG